MNLFSKMLASSFNLKVYQVVLFCLPGDSVGSILAYDALCRSNEPQSRHDSENNVLDQDNFTGMPTVEKILDVLI